MNMESTKFERYALLQAAATIYAGFISDPAYYRNLKAWSHTMSNERAIEKGLEFAIDRAEGLLVKLERIDSTRAEDIESKSDVLDFIEDGGKAGRTTDEILDHFAPTMMRYPRQLFLQNKTSGYWQKTAIESLLLADTWKSL